MRSAVKGHVPGFLHSRLNSLFPPFSLSWCAFLFPSAVLLSCQCPSLLPLTSLDLSKPPWCPAIGPKWPLTPEDWGLSPWPVGKWNLPTETKEGWCEHAQTHTRIYTCREMRQHKHAWTDQWIHTDTEVGRWEVELLHYWYSLRGELCFFSNRRSCLCSEQQRHNKVDEVNVTSRTLEKTPRSSSSVLMRTWPENCVSVTLS